MPPGVTPDEFDEEHSTVFTFTLEQVPGGTELTVVETGFETTSDPTANLDSHRSGWDAELDKLVALLESPSDDRDAGPGVRRVGGRDPVEHPGGARRG